jgi:hypothetical protein
MRTAAAVLSSVLLCASSSWAFMPAKPLSTVARSSRSSALRMSVAGLDELGAGESAPLGFFDPLGLSKGKDAATMKKWREAELKHGRVAMLAAVGMTIQEQFHPFFGLGDVDVGGAFQHFQEVEAVAPRFAALLVFVIGFIEGNQILTAWQPSEDVKPGEVAGLRPDYLTGDFGLDPLGVTKDPEAFKEMRTKELNNGRLAMIAVLGIWAEELLGKITEIV